MTEHSGVAGMESRPHLAFFCTLGLITSGCLLTLGLLVNYGTDQAPTLDDLSHVPGFSPPPTPGLPRPSPSPSYVDPWDQPSELPFPTAWPRQPRKPIIPSPVLPGG